MSGYTHFTSGKAMTMACFVLVLVLLTIQDDCVLSQQSARPLVLTKNGYVMGIKEINNRGVSYNAFRGLPYATQERFQSATPFSPWGGVRDGSQSGPICPQVNPVTKMAVGTEDCLFLNVFVSKRPEAREAQLVPVLVYLSDGMFLQGSSRETDPGHFMSHDVTLVVPQFRLGFLGFKISNVSGSPSNLQLLDQITMLRWVKGNIEAFGGDPTQVTLLGHGSGGVSAYFLYHMPESKDLFHKAVLLSGNAPFFHNSKMHQSSLEKVLGDLLQCPNSSVPAAIQHCLYIKSAHEVTLQTHEMAHNLIMPSPILDDGFGSITHLKSKPARRPLLIGVSRNDGLTLLPGVIERFQNLNVFNNEEVTIDNVIEGLLKIVEIEDHSGLLSELVKSRFFTAPPTPRLNLTSLIEGIVNFLGCYLVKAPAKKVKSQLGDDFPVYLHTFSYSNVVNNVTVDINGQRFVVQGVDSKVSTQFLFDTFSLGKDDVYVPSKALEKEDELVSRAYVHFLMDFISGTSNLKYAGQEEVYYDITNTISEEKNFSGVLFSSPLNISHIFS